MQPKGFADLQIISTGDIAVRDYLYIWNDPISQCIVTSGIEFRDIAGKIGLNGGIFLFVHGAEYSAKYLQHDSITHFDYIPREHIPDLAKENIYDWGDFTWVDYEGDRLPDISDREVAELLFFAHSSRPLTHITLPGLRNRYLCRIHDDGWFLKLFYSCWKDVESLIGNICPQLNLDEVHAGTTAYWISGSSIAIEERTLNPDVILNRRYHRRGTNSR